MNDYKVHPIHPIRHLKDWDEIDPYRFKRKLKKAHEDEEKDRCDSSSDDTEETTIIYQKNGKTCLIGQKKHRISLKS